MWQWKKVTFQDALGHPNYIALDILNASQIHNPTTLQTLLLSCIEKAVMICIIDKINFRWSWRA